MALHASNLLHRRDFLRRAGLTVAGLSFAEAIYADPYAWSTPIRSGANPIRIRGRVRSAGKGVPNVAVSDGFSVVGTDPDGYYELVSDPSRRWLSVTLPARSAIPISATGTAQNFRRITPDARGEMQALFELTRREHSNEEHTLLLLADPQTQDEYELKLLHEQTVPDVRETVRPLGDKEVFAVTCGDIMYDHLEYYPVYEKAVTAIGVPFFQVVGNHDLDQAHRTDETSVSTYERHFGPAYYSFDRGHMHYIVLDDVFWHGSGYIGYLDADQLAWLQADLSRLERGAAVVVITHIPVLGSQFRRRAQNSPAVTSAMMNREALYRLLEGYSAHVLVGHMHEIEHARHGGLMEHVNGAVCGAWWSGPVCHDGSPNGYSVYDVKGTELRWRYKATGQPSDHQLRLYARGADRSAPDEMVANVWNWDPGWTVIWYERGERRGAMARRTGLDPLAVELQLGEDKPKRREWVEPVPTDHLFYAAVTPGAPVRVEATDPFGNKYFAELAAV